MTSKQDVLNWLEKWTYLIEKTPDLIGSTEDMAGEARSISQHVAGRACSGCNGFGQKTYPSTSLWSGGVGGMAMTQGVCDKCWGTGRSDVTGPNLRAMRQTLPKPSTSADPMLCSYCGNPKNSTTCLRSHP